MSRGELNKSEETTIANKLPEIVGIQMTTASYFPDLISIDFSHSSTIPVASICLKDTVDMLSEARFGLFEAYAHQIWYSKQTDKSAKYVAVSLAKYFADDVALRLYAAAEHLANAIICMLEIERHELTSVKKSDINRVSTASALGKYLFKHFKEHKITKAIYKLLESDTWQKTILYRNKWVHEQPPLIEGTGIVWKRELLWREEGEKRPGVKARTVGIGGGSKPELNVDILLKDVNQAMEAFAKMVKIVVDFYQKLLQEKGKSPFKLGT